MSLTEQQVNELQSRVSFRDDQIELLNGFITDTASTSTPCLVVHGYKSVGKTLTVKQFLAQLSLSYTFLSCDEYLTNKLILSECLRRVQQDINASLKTETTDELEIYESSESFASFALDLQRYLKAIKYSGHHVLVLDRIDQSEDHFTLMSSIVRFHECYDIKNVSIIMISNQELPNKVLTASVPHIYFNPYTEQQIISIFQNNRFCNFDNEELNGSSTGKQFWDTYVQVIVELFYDFTGSNIYPLADLCVKHWPKFTETIKDGEYDLTKFIRIYRQNKDIFQDNSLLNSVVVDFDTKEIEKPGTTVSLDDMTHFAKFILVAAYLASYIDHKSDMNLFTKIKVVEHGRSKKKLELSKKDIDVKLLQPNFFDIERLFAVVLTIYRTQSKTFHDLDNELLKDVNRMFDDVSEMEFVAKEREINKFTMASNIDIYSQLASLLSQGLVYRQMTRDILQPRTRWRCELGWDTIQIVAKDIDFPLEQYLS